jgi:hypothetical protein
MAQIYYTPSDAADPYRLPDCEVFYHDGSADMVDFDGEPLEAGWYFWTCLPGCLPDSDPFGPYESESAAIEAAQDSAADSFA